MLTIFTSMKREYLSCDVFTLGSEKRQVSPHFRRHYLSYVTKRYTLMRREIFVNSYRFFFRSLSRAIVGKESFICFVPRADEKMRSILKEIKTLAPDNFFFLSEKWIGGFFSNFKIVRYNIERVFAYRLERGKRKLNYSGLAGLRSIPINLLALGGKSCDTAIKDAQFNPKVRTIYSVRSSMDKVSKYKTVNLIVNHSDVRVLYMILGNVLRMFEKNRLK